MTLDVNTNQKNGSHKAPTKKLAAGYTTEMPAHQKSNLAVSPAAAETSDALHTINEDPESHSFTKEGLQLEAPTIDGAPPGCGAGGASVHLPSSKSPKRKIEATYPYVDEDGNYLFEKVREKGKHFILRRRIGKNQFEYSLGGVRQVPYRLNEYAKDTGLLVFVVEGEKDVETARSLGLVATCGPHGGNVWPMEYGQYLKEHRVCILPDKDKAGEEYAQKVAKSVNGICREWCILRLPGLPEKGDLSDFVSKTTTREDILLLAEAAFAAYKDQEFPIPADSTNKHLTNNHLPPQPAELEWSIESCTFAEIKPEPIVWLMEPLWQDHCINLLVGQANAGKTFLACYLAAAVSRGMQIPDSSKRFPIGDVLYVTTENNLNQVMRPRLEEAGADLTRVHTWKLKRKKDRNGEEVDAEVTLEDIDAISKWCDSFPDLRLVVMDPVTGYMGDVDHNDNKEVRRVLQKAQQLAETKKFCLLLLTHLKKADAQGINAAIGAQAFVAVPRVVNALIRDPDDDEGKIRCLVPVKNNNGPMDHGKKFILVKHTEASPVPHILWDSAKEMRSADALITASAAKSSTYGRENYQEKGLVTNGNKYLDMLDSMVSDPEGWVPHFQIRKELGWSGTRATDVVDWLKTENKIETRFASKEMPNGNEQESGRREVRRKRHDEEWNSVQ